MREVTGGRQVGKGGDSERRRSAVWKLSKHEGGSPGGYALFEKVKKGQDGKFFLPEWF